MIESRQVTVTGVNAPVTVFKGINTQGYYTELCNYGASVLSIIVPDRQGKADDVLLGYPELSDHIQDGPYLGKTLGRFAGRIAKGKFTLNGQSYQLDINNGPNHLHGGAQGLSFRLWEYRQCSENSLRFTTTAQHLEDGYPGDCAISVEYTWTEDNTLIIDYHGTPTADSILNLSNHSYFNLAGTPTILGHQLRIHANEYLPLNADSIPEFPARSVSDSPMDFRVFTPIGTKMNGLHPQLAIDRGYNHCWLVDPAAQSETIPAVELACPENGRLLQIFSDYPGAVVYCGNYFDGRQMDKNQHPLNAYAGIAIEMQYYPNSPNMPGVPSCIVHKGETSHHRIRYGFKSC